MALFRVVWEIDIDADCPYCAADFALEIQRNPESTATVFKIIDDRCPDNIVEIDFDPF